MPGYISTAFDFIEDLRRNLRDRYKDCHAVLKELLQNADDACATRVEISWAEQVNGLAHPLLQGPLLFVYNDAPFSFNDALAVHRQGIGTKGHERGKIGKFGLGLKSVFHLCEAFFYLSDGAGDADSKPEDMPPGICRTGILNPWDDIKKPRYPEWEQFSQDSADGRELRSFVERQFRKEDESWFCLVIPLRRRSHCRKEADDNPDKWAIEPRYYGETPEPPNDLFCERRISDARRVLPLLSTVDHIGFSQLAPSTAKDGRVSPVAAVSRTPSHSSTRTAWRSSDWHGRHAISGTVEVLAADRSAESSRYAGIEESLDIELLTALRGREGWPYTNAQTDQGIIREPAVACQHAAAVFADGPAGSRHASFGWQKAVFLPLGKHEETSDGQADGKQFHLLLHGYFFVDAGRLDVDLSEDGDNPTISQKWNQALLELGTLPLIVPALDEYASSLVDADEEAQQTVQRLTFLIKRSGLWHRYRERICAKEGWVYCLAPNGATWRVVETASSIHMLPGDGETPPGLPLDVFPELQTVPLGKEITLAGLPLLTAQDPSPWASDSVVRLLNSVPADGICDSSERIEYLKSAVDFFVGEGHVRSMRIAMVGLLRRIVRVTPPAMLRRHRDTVASLVRCLDPSDILRVEHDPHLVGESDRIFDKIAHLDLGPLPVPSYLLPDGPVGSARLSEDDARLVLAALEDDTATGTQDEPYNRLKARIAAHVLASWHGDPAQAVQVLGDSCVFAVRIGAGEKRVLSLRQLAACLEESLLFARSASLRPSLEKAIADRDISWLPYTDLEVLSCLERLLGPIPACDSAACVRSLNRLHVLSADPQRRLELYVELIRAWDGAYHQGTLRALRYLLHADIDAAKSQNSIKLLVSSEGDPWSALAQDILEARQEVWRLIDTCFHAETVPGKARALSLCECSPAVLGAVLGENSHIPTGCPRITANDEWRRAVIRDWPEGQDHDELLRQLPIFRTPDGRFAPIDEQTFIQEGDECPPPEIFPDYRLVVREEGAAGDRLRRISRSMDTDSLLCAALGRADCASHYQWILESIPDSPTDELRRLLRTMPWLPVASGEAVAPCQVIHREGLEEHVRALSSEGAEVVASADLHHDLLAHPFWQRVRSGYIPSGEALYRVLGRAVRSSESYAMGTLALEDMNIVEVASVLGDGTEGQEVMPAADLVLKLHSASSSATDGKWLQEHISPNVCRPVPADRAALVLKHLSRLHAGSGLTDRKQILRLFNAYLAESLQQPGFSLVHVDLLSRANKWVSARRLAVSGDNISPANLLNDSHVDVLSSAVLSPPHSSSGSPQSLAIMDASPPDDNALRDGCEALGNYCEWWREDDTSGESLAMVVSLLGDHDGFPELFDRLREVRDLRQMREEFFWTTAIEGWDLADLMRNHRFLIRPAAPDTVRAVNLLGEPFQAEVAEQLNAVFDGFDGRTYFRLPGGARCHVLSLRQIQPEDLSAEQRTRILRTTAESIRRLIYQQGVGEDSAVVERICQASQLEIEVAQEMILDSSVLLIQNQLSARKSNSLRDVFSRWNHLRRSMAAAKQAEDERALRQADTERRDILATLRELLTEDAETQTILLEESLRRLRAASYQAQSVPFEIFQNADDAVVELGSFFDGGTVPGHTRSPELLCRFVMEYAEEIGQPVIRFIHWGRAVNQFRLAGVDRSSAGYDLDLERMLVMQGSGKDDESTAPHRTGKFGLGFKSVFFLTDSPRVLSSSRSRFQTKAAIYPVELDPQDERRLETRLSEEGDARHQGTVIELPLRDATEASAVFEGFSSVAGVLAAFSRQVRRLIIEAPSGDSVCAEWNPSCLPVIGQIEQGNLLLHPRQEDRGLVFRCSSDGYDAVLFELGTNGIICSGLRDLPSIWVTNPTSHHASSSVLVNGAFELNPGRTQLRNVEENKQRSQAIGAALGELLCALYDRASDDWTTVADWLCTRGLTFDKFWTSFWDSCLPHARPADDITTADGVLHAVLFGGPSQGIRCLVQDRAALPTGMPGRYGCLAKASSVRHVVVGLLADPEIWADALGHGAWLSGTVLPGSAISSGCFEAAAIVFEDRPARLALVDVLSQELGDRCVEPDHAEDLGAMVDRERLSNAGSVRGWDMDEAEDLQELLASASFLTQAGSWRASDGLLAGHGVKLGTDESMRAAFAPDDHVLSAGYPPQGVEFFLACRGDLRAPAESLVDWGLEAESLEKRQAFLRYLRDGELGSRARYLLSAHPDRSSTWIANADEFAAVTANMALEERMRAAADVGRAEDLRQELIDQERGKLGSRPGGQIDPAKALSDLWDWWSQNRRGILAAYEEMVYPQGRGPELDLSAGPDALEHCPETRREWLRLLMLGVMGRMGRTRPQQHREFIARCEDQGWLAAMALPMDEDAPSRWFGILDDFLSVSVGDGEYFHWLNQLAAYYQVAWYLPQYARAFSAVTRPGVRLDDLGSIKDIADLRTSHIFAGSTGFIAPPCMRVMGPGAFFLLRETVRARFAQASKNKEKYEVADGVAEQCYVPTRALVELFGRLGLKLTLGGPLDRPANSRAIFRLVAEHLGPDRARFQGAFDVPFVMLNTDRYLADRTAIFGDDAQMSEVVSEDPFDLSLDAEPPEESDE